MNIHKALRFGLFAGLVTVIASTLVLGAIPTPTASASPAIGDWEGQIDTGSGSLRVVVHISQAADGKLTGSLDSPDQDATGIAIGTITYKEPDLRFGIESLGSSYQGTMNHDNSAIAGEWKQSGRSLPLVFKRRSK
ncbi:MAG TPA: hypothetical protein VKY85_02935 [Candidatus Angelobacter sp.]|nr:hypothetical protein [Candidatus Angelobacter sp.]